MTSVEKSGHAPSSGNQETYGKFVLIPTGALQDTATADSQGGDDLSWIIGALGMWKGTILLVVLVVTSAVLAWSFRMKPVYQAQVSFLPSDSGSGGQLQALAAQFGGLGGLLSPGLEKGISTQLSNILKSRALAEEVVQRIPELKSILVDPPPAEEPSLDFFANTLAGSLEIQSKGVLTLTVELTNATVAARVANEYMNALASFVNQTSFTQASRNRKYIEEQVQRYRVELTTAEEQLKEFQIRNRLVSVGAQTDTALRVISELQAKLMAKQIEREILLKSATDNAPQVKRLDVEIEIHKEQINRLESGSDSVFNETQIGKTDNELQHLVGSMASAPQLLLDYYRLRRNVDLFQKLYELLSQQFEMSKIDEQREIPSFFVLDKAMISNRIVKPRIRNNALLAGFSSLLCASFLILVYETTSRRDRGNPDKPLSTQKA